MWQNHGLCTLGGPESIALVNFKERGRQYITPLHTIPVIFSTVWVCSICKVATVSLEDFFSNEFGQNIFEFGWFIEFTLPRRGLSHMPSVARAVRLTFVAFWRLQNDVGAVGPFPSILAFFGDERKVIPGVHFCSMEKHFFPSIAQEFNDNSWSWNQLIYNN